jgi:hypothetical protein
MKTGFWLRNSKGKLARATEFHSFAAKIQNMKLIAFFEDFFWSLQNYH